MDPENQDLIDAIETPDEEDVPNEEILDAINDELEATAPEPEAEPEAPEDPAQPELLAEEPANEEPEAEVDEPEPEPEAEIAAKATDDGQPEPPEQPEPEAEAKPSDEFGTLDEDTPKKTQERFETLKSRYDDLVAERDAVKAESDQWVQAITGTGTNPEQFGMALEYLGYVNSGSPEDLERAYTIMSNELGALAQALGKPAPGVYDPLSEHQDLKQRVSEGELSEDDAHELARARATTKLSAAQQQQAAQKTQHEASVQKAMDSVGELGKQLAATDPNFQAKLPYLEPIVASVVESGLPPEKWQSMIHQAYIKLPDPPAAQPAPPQPKVPDPIRPTGASPSSGDMGKEPGSMLEAISDSLERGY